MAPLASRALKHGVVKMPSIWPRRASCGECSSRSRNTENFRLDEPAFNTRIASVSAACQQARALAPLAFFPAGGRGKTSCTSEVRLQLISMRTGKPGGAIALDSDASIVRMSGASILRITSNTAPRLTTPFDSDSDQQKDFP